MNEWLDSEEKVIEDDIAAVNTTQKSLHPPRNDAIEETPMNHHHLPIPSSSPRRTKVCSDELLLGNNGSWKKSPKATDACLPHCRRTNLVPPSCSRKLLPLVIAYGGMYIVHPSPRDSPLLRPIPDPVRYALCYKR